MKKKGNEVPSMLILYVSALITLIVFIGLIVGKTGDYTSQSEINKKTSQEFITTHLSFKEISAGDGLSGKLENFSIVASPDDGSSKIRLDRLKIIFSSNRGTAILAYRECDIPNTQNNSCFNTFNIEQVGLVNSTDWTTLKEDYDDDSKDDSVIILNESYLRFNLSYAGVFDYSLGAVNLTNASEVPQTINVEKTEIGNATENYGSFFVSGISNINMSISQNIDFSVIPKNSEKGYYTIEYAGIGNDFTTGTISKKDAVRIYFEFPTGIFYGDEFSLKLVPEKGLTSSIDFHVTENFKERKVFFAVTK